MHLKKNVTKDQDCILICLDVNNMNYYCYMKGNKAIDTKSRKLMSLFISGSQTMTKTYIDTQ